jgi:hypothetical protein
VQRVRPGQLVRAVGRDDERAQLLDAPPQPTEDVERRLIGSVHILQHHDRSPAAAQLFDERVEHAVKRLARRDRCLEPSSDGRGDVDQRTQRARRAQAVARPYQQSLWSGRRAERSHQGALPDASVTQDEHQAPLPAPGVRERLRKHRRRAFTLQQLRRRARHRRHDEHPLPARRPAQGVG